MRKTTVTAKYAQSLHAEIQRRDVSIAQLERELEHRRDELHEAKVRTAVLQDQVDALALKVEKMGKDLGQANAREIATRHVVCVALAGIGTLAHSVKVAPADQVSTTAFALERDGRAQLERAKNGNGAHA